MNYENIKLIWVIVRFEEANQKLQSLIDTGNFEGANALNQSIQRIIDSLKLFVQNSGGSIPLSTLNRIVFAISPSKAVELPNLFDGYKDRLGKTLAIGMGLSFDEASKAAKRATYTHKIELYENNADFNKTESTRFSDGVILPPNLFDPNIPDDSERKELLNKPNEIKQNSLEEDLQRESEYIQMVAAQMNPQPQQQEQNETQQSEQQSPQTRDLLESLMGQQIKDHNPVQQQNMPQKKPNKEQEQELIQAVDNAEDEANDVNEKLAGMLHKIKIQIPQLMALAEKNPKAFQQSMIMIQKLLSIAHQQKGKKTKKSEDRKAIEELIKNFNTRASLRHLKRLKLPINTRKKRYKKVLVDGKEVWRQMAAGQVKDSHGQPISVRESNKEANKNSG